MSWAKGPGGGYSDTTQVVPWEDMLAWQLELYLRSCWLYYHDKTHQPVLSDEGHDRTEAILQAHFDELPEWLKTQVPNKQLKPAAHSLEIPEDVKLRAIAWSKEFNV